MDVVWTTLDSGHLVGDLVCVQTHHVIKTLKPLGDSLDAICTCLDLQLSTEKVSEGRRKEARKEGRKEGRREGRKEGRKACGRHDDDDDQTMTIRRRR